MKSKMVRKTIGCAVAMLTLLSTPVAGAKSHEEFFAEYEPAAKKLEEFYSAVTMDAVQQRTRLGADRTSETTVREELKLYTSGDDLRVDAVITRDGKPTDQVSVATPEKAFVVARDGDAERFVLRDMTQDFARSASAVRNRYHALFAPFSAGLGGESILQRLKAPTTTITGIREETKDGETFVEVSYQYPLPDPLPKSSKPRQAREARGSYTFAKDRAWVAVKSEWWPGADQEGHLSGKMEYDGSQDGVPLLRKVVFLRDTLGRTLKWIELDVTKIVPGIAPQRDFKLAAFGIHDVSEEKETNYWLFLIVSGIVLLAAALIVGRLAASNRAH